MIHRQSSQSSSDWSSSSTSSDATGSSRSRRSRRRNKSTDRRPAARRLTVEGLEKRQMLAANPFGQFPEMDTYNGPRNIGTVSSFKYREKEPANISGLNDYFQDAEFVPLGNAPGQRDTIDISGSVHYRQIGSQFISDVDYYSFDLQAGDILDIAVIGSAATFDVLLPNPTNGQASGKIWFAQGDTLTPVPAFDVYPVSSPLQNIGNAYAAQIAPYSGRYSVAVSSESLVATNYTLGLRTYRPVTESLPIGQGQVVFLDFDGGSFAKDDFNINFAQAGIPTGGRFRVPDITQTLSDAGLVVGDQSEYERISRNIIQTVERQLADVGVYGANGSYAATGIPGSYGVTLLNSLEHPDPGNNPLVTRVVFGSVNSFADITAGANLLGIAQTVDVGNFDLSETVLVFVDNEVLSSATVPTTAAYSQFDVLGLGIGATTTHELAHVFGLYHTDGSNLVYSLIDGGGVQNDQNGLGVGPDGILGTLDDTPVRFRNDIADPNGLITFGTLYSVESMSYGLSTGKKGGSLSGRVFRDLNSDGIGTGDPGLAGVRVFLDLNNNGVLDPSEPSTLSDANGAYSLQAAPGTYTVVALPGPATTSSQPINVSSNGVVTNSGSNPADRTIPAGSTVFVDYDFDGIRDFNEPSAVVDNNGVYLLTGVTPGSYSLHVLAPGNFNPTTATSQSVTLTSTGTTGPSFGFGTINPAVTGKKYADLNNNGRFDPGEPGIPGVYIYADLDGDNRPGLGEPFAYTDADGNYKLELPNLGRPYAIREVQVPGFIRTEPANTEGEWTINYAGVPLGSNFNFGSLPSRDYGDAPDTYFTTIAAGGPSHGLLAGLTIGQLVDAEFDGQPSTDALGDDLSGTFDDEDGVVVREALRPGRTGFIDVTLTNTTGRDAYLQAWIDFNGNGKFDANEQIVTDAVLGTGVHTIPVTLPPDFDVNIDGSNDGVLNTFSRFRYSHTPGLGVGGPADTGEVEDHAIRILAASNTGGAATDDFLSVSQNATNVALDVLANDSNSPSNPLTITNLDLTNTKPEVAGKPPTKGIVTISGAVGQQVIRYSPPRNFTGKDYFVYTVKDSSGATDYAVVEVTVRFGSDRPIAIDDIFEIPSTQKSVPLNVLDNDIVSAGGAGLTITQVSRGDHGGILTLQPGQRGLLYTPADGFVGTEQFEYTISDGTGAPSSSAIGTVVLMPQAIQNNKASFKVELLDRNNDVELLSLQAGQEFRVRVSVDDIFRSDTTAVQGLASAFTDLLYTAELVTPTNNDPTTGFPFDITFGPRFMTRTFVPDEFQSGSALTPGIINEVGSTQSIADLLTAGKTPDRASFTGFAELFTITMQATGVGLATFKTDPADALASETALVATGNPITLTYDEITYGSASIQISPPGAGFPVAIDDSFPLGLDSDNQPIRHDRPARLDVLANDNIGAANGNQVLDYVVKEAPLNGTVTRVVDSRGDYFAYTPREGFEGFDRFSYILSVESPEFGTVVRSIAEVTMTVGAVQDPQVHYKFTVVDEAGVPIPENRSIPVGQRFGVRIDATELDSRNGQPTNRAAFAGFLDILYSSNILSTIPVNTGGDPNLFDFDVKFDSQFDLGSAVGVNDRPGLIDEFGSNRTSLSSSGVRMATVYFRATQAGKATVTGSPADRFPFQDTLLSENDRPVPVANIQYDSVTINIIGSGEPMQNPSLPQDVNGDNLVTAVDALIVINELARREASGESAATDAHQYYYDVNGDGYITAIDALQVINSLNEAKAPAGEEIVPSPLQLVERESSNDPTELAIADLAADAKLVDASSAAAAAVLPPVNPISTSSAHDADDDDELLSLLADDIANQWS